MSISKEFVWILIGTALVTFIPRTLPLVFISKLELPEYVKKFLTHVPLAVMTALVVQSVLTSGEEWLSFGEDLQWIALFPTLAVAVVTRSLLLTVLTGIATAALLVWLI